jgi:hypothetical protein
LPKELGKTVAKRMRKAYHGPGGAASLREGLSETLTVQRLAVSPTLARTLRSTNAIESMNSIARPTAATSNTGRRGTWRCADAPPAWSKHASS